jgi:perosamine synthetase
MFSELDISPIIDLLKNKDISGWFKSHEGGEKLREFEKRFAQFCGGKHGFAVSSGSVSIYLALRACNIGRGDVVAVPPYTHIGSVAPIMLAGAKPLFIDVDKYGNIDPEQLRKTLSLKLAKGKVKAVIVVHQLGLPCEMDAIKEVSDDAFIIEDASHALGAEYKGVKAGVLGDIGCFSIGGGRTKTIGTGEGGMVITNSGEMAMKLKNLRNHGDRNTDCDYLCFNFRMSELQAAIGLAQMDKLQFWIDWQIKNAEYIIANLPEYLEVPVPPNYVKHVHYIIGCRYLDTMLHISRDALMKKIIEGGFEGGVPRRNIGIGYSKLISDIRIYTSYRRKCPISQKLQDESIWIDWHRYPRTIDEIDDLLAFLKRI